MKYSKLEVLRKFRNVFFVLTVIFLSVIVADIIKVTKVGGSIRVVKHRLFMDPGLILPFAIALVMWLIFWWRFRAEKKM